MKIVLYIIAGIIGLFVYGMIGVGVFILTAKVTGEDWKHIVREESDNDSSAIIGCITCWPILLVMYVIGAPVFLIKYILEKLAER